MSIRRKFEEARDRAAALAAQAERTEAEDAEMVAMLDRAEQLKAELEQAAEIDARIEALGDVSRAIAIPGTLLDTRSEAPELTAGEYFAAAAEWMNGGSVDAFRNRAARYLDRATGVSADVAGILPTPIIGPLLDTFDTRRKVWASFTSRTMPSEGKTFERPFVTQHTQVGEQAAEADPLASRKFTIDSDTVTKRTIGGTLEVSRQMQDWTTPEALGLVVVDFLGQYARFTETAAVTHLLGLATAYESYDDTNTASIVKSFVDGYLAVAAEIDNDIPCTVWLSPDTAAELTAPSGSTDRPTIAVVREALSALDASVNWVTSRRLPAGTRIIGAGELVESYEQRHGLLSMVKPTNLTTDVAYSGYIAFYGVEDGFVNLSDVGS